MPEEFRISHHEYIKSHFAAGQSDGPIDHRRELLAVHRDGGVFPVELSLSPVRCAGRSFVIAIARDISERKRMEASLRQSQRWLAGTLSSPRDAIFVIDAKSMRTVDCNPAACAMFGYTREELLSSVEEVRALIHVDAQTAHSFLQHLYRSTEERGFLEGLVLPMRHKDGSMFLAERTLTPIVDDAGNTIGWVTLARDITERKHLEAELITAKKLETVGQLAAGIAHEFRNLLTVILGNLSLARDCAPFDDNDLHTALLQAERAATRATRLTTQLLTFAAGLGLTAAQSIVLNHGGRICVASLAGAGATFTIFFPSAVSQ